MAEKDKEYKDVDLKAYFEAHQGVGVLATADSNGKVNAAIYSRPHVENESTVSFLMADRRSRANVDANPKAAYLFKVDGGYEGVRIYMTKTATEKDPDAIRKWREMRGYRGPSYSDEGKWIVTFLVDEVRPLTGSED